MWVRFDANAAINMSHVQRLFFFRAENQTGLQTVRAHMASGDFYDLVTVPDLDAAHAIMETIHSDLASGFALCDIRRTQRHDAKAEKPETPEVQSKAAPLEVDYRDEIIKAQAEHIRLLGEISTDGIRIISDLIARPQASQSKSKVSDVATVAS